MGKLHRGELLATLRKSFFAGLLLLLPLGVTVVIFHFLVTSIGEPFKRFFFGWVVHSLMLDHNPLVDLFLNLISVTFVAVFVTLFGYFSTYFFGKFFVNSMDKILSSLPFLSTVYKTSKQIVQTFMEGQRSAFKQAVLIEYPRTGCYTIGFLTSDQTFETSEKTGRTLVNIFVPTTPNPTSGFFLMIPKESLIFLDMSVGEAMKLVISGGAIVPQKHN